MLVKAKKWQGTLHTTSWHVMLFYILPPKFCAARRLFVFPLSHTRCPSLIFLKTHTHTLHTHTHTHTSSCCDRNDPGFTELWMLLCCPAEERDGGGPMLRCVVL